MTKAGHLRRTSNVDDPYKRGTDYPSQDDNLESFIKNWERYSKRLILFLGAGASVGAVNKLGKRLPQAYDLRNELYSEFLLTPEQRKDFDVSNLSLLSLEHVAALAEASSDRRCVEDFVAERFMVTQPLWQHAVLPFLNPLAVFTTNYDNLIELGWRLHTAQEGIKPITPLFKETSKLHDDFVPLYKSHGTVELPHKRAGVGGMIISQFDYFEMIHQRKEMLNQFTTDFNEYCFVAIGYSFQDVDIASRLYEIRQDRNGRNWYAVFPRNSPSVRNMYFDKYKLMQINRTFHDFLLDLDERVNFIPDEWKFDRIDELVARGLIYGENKRSSNNKRTRTIQAKKSRC
jgi:hypothetical protein